MTNYIKEYMKDNNIQFGQKCYLIDDDSEGTIIGENCYLDIISDTGYIELHNPLFEDDEDMSLAILMLILQGLIEMVPMDRIKGE